MSRRKSLPVPARQSREGVCVGTNSPNGSSEVDKDKELADATKFAASLELVVVARPYDLAHPSKEHGVRDIHLQSKDAEEGARDVELWHTRCPLNQTRTIVLWAKYVLGIPLVEEPPGNLSPGWKWPEESKNSSAQAAQAPASVKPSSFLDFGD